MALDAREQDNFLRWDGQRRGWYEVYYLKWNDAASRTAAWIRYTLTSPRERVGQPYCELWGIFFDVDRPANNFAVKNRFPIDRLAVGRDHFRVGIADAELTMNACHAQLTDEQTGHRLSWNLTFDSTVPTYRYFPHESFYTGTFPKTKGLSPHVHARFSGTVIANGRKINVKNAPGQQTHLWGTKHAHRWAWGHCNTFREDPDAIWEGLDAQIRLGPLNSPHFKLFYLRHGGRDYYFNRPAQWLTNASRWDLGHWTFHLTSNELDAVGAIVCRDDEMVAVTYTDPDGEKLWCNNSKVASLRLTLLDKSGRQLAELTSDHGCAAEFVDRRTYPQVPVRL